MALARQAEPKRKYYTVEEANKALPLVKAIVSDIVRQFQTVNDLKQRLSRVGFDRKQALGGELYAEEIAQSQAELNNEETKLEGYIEELNKLGVELKGPLDGLCDFYSILDGREVYLCWRLGEPEVAYWHELNAGIIGRQPLIAEVGPKSGKRGI